MTDPICSPSPWLDGVAAEEEEAVFDLQVFTSDGLWTKPSNARWVQVIAFGGGGGGGSGGRWSSAVNRFGGGGGASGSGVVAWLPASLLGVTEAVVVGPGGQGGPAVAVNDTEGNPGLSGGNSTFGLWAAARGGNNGDGGTQGAGLGGLATGLLAGDYQGLPGGDGQSSGDGDNAPGGLGAAFAHPAGGGGGAGGMPAGSSPQNEGGNGYQGCPALLTVAPGGGVGGDNGAPGNPGQDIAVGYPGGGGGGVGDTEIPVADGPNRVAFGRLRVASPAVLFDSQLMMDNQPLLWDGIVTAGGSNTYSAQMAANILAVTTTPNAAAARQTKAYHRYRPGHSLKIIQTFNLRPAVGNVTKRVGYFDANDGIFLQQAGSGAMSLVRRTSVSGVPVDNAVAQAAWNIDPMDGNGPSGAALNWTLAQNMLIDLQWLGVGRVRIGFYIGGRLFYVHQFLGANVLSTVFIRTACLPVRYEIAATGAAASGAELHEICVSVVAEGGPAAGGGVGGCRGARAR